MRRANKGFGSNLWRWPRRCTPIKVTNTFGLIRLRARCAERVDDRCGWNPQCAAPITGTSGASGNREGAATASAPSPSPGSAVASHQRIPPRKRLMSVLSQQRPFIIVRAARTRQRSPPRQMCAATARSAPGQRRAARENEGTSFAHRVHARAHRANAPRPAGTRRPVRNRRPAGSCAERGAPHRLRQRHDGDPLRPPDGTPQPPLLRHHPRQSSRAARLRRLASVSAVYRPALRGLDRPHLRAGVRLVEEERHRHPPCDRRDRAGVHTSGNRHDHPVVGRLRLLEPGDQAQGIRQVRDRCRNPRIVQ